MPTEVSETEYRHIRPANRDRQADVLRRAALRYLERYASSEANLRRILKLKLDRRRAADPDRWSTEDDVCAALIDDAVAACRELGLIDDGSYAAMRMASGRRRGHSARRIQSAMAAKGVPRAVVEEVLADDSASEEIAALVYARRRRLGPFRTGGRSVDGDRRDIAALCRQGFAYPLARRVVAMDGTEADTALAAAGGADP